MWIVERELKMLEAERDRGEEERDRPPTDFIYFTFQPLTGVLFFFLHFSHVGGGGSPSRGADAPNPKCAESSFKSDDRLNRAAASRPAYLTPAVLCRQGRLISHVLSSPVRARPL